MRIALGIEYDGRPFCGWQSQPSRCGIQDAIEATLEQIAGVPVSLIAAGRTDQGVHASVQVAHFDTESRRPLGAWVRGVNGKLPPAVAVRWACPVPPEFHARFSARRRTYHYLLLNRPQRPGMLAGRVGWCHRPLDVSAMGAGAQHLLGEHDFSAFRSAQCQAKSPVKTMEAIAIQADGPLISLEFGATAFLQHMVRNIIGALVMVGTGARPATWIREVLATRDRTQAAPTFMPDGLYLSGIEYDPRFGLPSTMPRHPWKPN
ncbi:MAG: tRNA pseudouridine(38-40) synthase TruA [Betaproteobacteria bacterium]